ncbi:MAG: hypothetical protein GX663_09500 [Clostridiales bacterium]|nr:hypothetical protein [Clostridiales bacterium]
MKKTNSNKKDTIVILGAGQMGKAVAEALNPNKTKLLGFGDNDSKKWNKIIKPVDKSIGLKPDIIIISVLDDERANQLEEQAYECGFNGEIVNLKAVYGMFDIRSKTIKSIANRINEKKIPGEIAELGVYKGDITWQLNYLFPKRSLHLFDTFEGFDERDIYKEKENLYSEAKKGDFRDTSVSDVMERVMYPQNVVVKKGFFPDTADWHWETNYAFVSIDTDLYAPTLAGIEYFYPKLSEGGVIIMHDYNSLQFRGVKKAVDEYEKRCGLLKIIPVGDLHGSCVILK